MVSTDSHHNEMASVAAALGVLLILWGLGWLVYERTPLKVQVSLWSAQRRARLIYREGLNRIEGRPYKDPPAPLVVDRRVPVWMAVAGSGFLLLALALSLQEEASPASSPSSPDVQPASPRAAEDDVRPFVKSEIQGVTTNQARMLFLRDGPGTGYGVLWSLGPGSVVTVVCQVHGETIYGPRRTTDLWLKTSLPTDGWVSAAYVESAESPSC